MASTTTSSSPAPPPTSSFTSTSITCTATASAAPATPLRTRYSNIFNGYTGYISYDGFHDDGALFNDIFCNHFVYDGFLHDNILYTVDTNNLHDHCFCLHQILYKQLPDEQFHYNRTFYDSFLCDCGLYNNVLRDDVIYKHVLYDKVHYGQVRYMCTLHCNILYDRVMYRNIFYDHIPCNHVVCSSSPWDARHALISYDYSDYNVYSSALSGRVFCDHTIVLHNSDFVYGHTVLDEVPNNYVCDHSFRGSIVFDHIVHKYVAIYY